MNTDSISGASAPADKTDAAGESGSTSVITVVLCYLAVLCEGIDLQAAGVANTGIKPEFNPSNSEVSHFLAASTFGLVIGALLGGRLADWVGRKTVLVTSIGVFGVFSLLTALGSDISMLTYMRFLTGVGLGGALPNLIALVSEMSSEHRRSANVGVVYAGAPSGGALASYIGLLFTAVHWRYVFVVGGLVPIVLVPVMFFALPESRAFRALQAARAAGQVEAERSSRFEGLVGLFSESRAVRTVLLWVSFLLALLVLYLLLSWLPTLMVSNGMSKHDAFVVQIGFNLGGVLSALLIGRLLEGPLRQLSIIVTFVGVPVLLWVLSRTAPVLEPVATVVTLLGMVVMASQTILYAFAPTCYPTHIRGAGVGAAVGMGRCGSVLGPLIAGMLVGAGRSPDQVLTNLLPIVIVGGICAIVLSRLMPRNRGLTL